MGEAVLVDYSEVEELDSLDFYVTLKPYDVLLCKIEDVILWKNQMYPVFLLSIITIGFSLVWLLDPSLITLASAAGIVCVAVDFLARCSYVEKYRTKVDNRNELEEQYRSICLKMVRMRRVALHIHRQLSLNRQNEPNKHFLYCTLFFVSLAWIGCRIHNLLLLYVLVCFVALLPGVKRNDVSSHYYKWIMSKLRRGGPIKDKSN